MSNSFILIYMTASSEEEASTISKTLVEERLVACANMMPRHKSFYWWDGAVQQEAEHAVLFKTTADKFKKVEARVKDLHSYDVPCVVSFDISQGAQSFLDWIAAETQSG